VSVVNAAHEHVVSLIRKAGDTLVLKVVHVEPQPPQHSTFTGIYSPVAALRPKYSVGEGYEKGVGGVALAVTAGVRGTSLEFF